MNNQEAIKSMNNLDELISITESEHESVRMAISALEKQIPKKPVKHNINTTWNYDCECGWRLISKINSEWIAGTKAWFCPKCGQAIDWEGEDE